jgi:hypothetical protein
VFKTGATLEETAGTPLAGGTDGSATAVTHQKALNALESYSFNVLCCASDDETIKKLYVAYTKRMRDEMGVKFQLVVYDYTKADYMGVISVKNPTSDEGWNKASLVYWVTGISAGCEVNKSNQNKIYDGEFTVEADYTQSELTKAIKAGEFTLHNVNGVIRVLDDINTMVTTSDTCGDVFKDNQTIRVIDQIGNDIAVLFAEKYLGVVSNDESGRISLWSDIVKHHQELMQIRAIENFEDSDIVVTQGDTKKAVVVSDAVTVVNAMGKLYMTVSVS